MDGGSNLSRRDFLKLFAAAGTGLAFAPFVPFGNFMPNPSAATLERVPVYLTSTNVQASVHTFPVNTSEVITYPRTGDSVLDGEAFRQWQFIRLPEQLGGGNNDASAFRAYSMVCLHLWCLWKYNGDNSTSKTNKGDCPCHGSSYEPVNGQAIQGPASVQAEPSNVLPMLDLEVDSDGLVWIKPPKFTAHENGVIGYGRFL